VTYASCRSVVLSRWHMRHSEVLSCPGETCVVEKCFSVPVTMCNSEALPCTGDNASFRSVVLSRWHMCHSEVLSCPGDICVVQKCCPVPMTHASFRSVVLSRWHMRHTEVLSCSAHTCVIQKVPVTQMCHTEESHVPVTHVSYRSVFCPGDTCVIQKVPVTLTCHTEVLSCPGDTCVIQKVPVTHMCHTEECCPAMVTHMSYRSEILVFYVLVSTISDSRRSGSKLRHNEYFICTILKFNSPDVRTLWTQKRRHPIWHLLKLTFITPTLRQSRLKNITCWCKLSCPLSVSSSSHQPPCRYSISR
jgi:hypothetical protein